MAGDETDVVKMNNYSLPEEEESQVSKKASQKKRNRKRKRKFARKNAQHGVNKNKKKQPKLAQTMSTWAESFTVAATWQLKHQLAYWKAKAKVLAYENKVLHDIVRKKNYIDDVPELSTTQPESSDIEDEEEFEDNGEDDEELEVSEEFIQFLRANAKYKEDARQERERLKAQSFSEDNEIERLEAGPSESVENVEEKLKELYGDKWQRISALEMSLQSQFISESDKEKPMYWPNIPFNFNFG